MENEHPSQSKRPYLPPPDWSGQPYTYPSRYGSDYYEKVTVTGDATNLALLRTTEKFTHELEMVKNLLTAILNSLDMQGAAIDELFDMVDCLVGSIEDDQP